MSGCRLIFGRKSGILIRRISYVRVLIYLQRYRSGHNGADSKSVCEQSHVGSNPTRCAKLEATF